MRSLDPWIAAWFAFLPVLYASIFVHELGHAVAGRLVGFVVTSFGLGTARPWFVAVIHGVRIYFCPVRSTQGITFAFIPQIFPSRARMALYAAGGIVANGILAAVALGLVHYLPAADGVWFTVAVVNGLLVGTSLIPLKFRVGNAILRTDGALILESFRSGMFASPPPIVIQNVRSLRGLWFSIGDTLVLRIQLYAAAEAWIALGDFERADELCREADSLPGPSTPHIQAVRGLVRSEVALRAGRLDDADTALDEPEAHFRTTGHAVGLFLVAAYRANVRICQGDLPTASRELDDLASDPLLAGFPALATILLTTRLSAAIAASDIDAVERLQAHTRPPGSRRCSAARDSQVDRAVARFNDAQGDHAAAEAAYRRAIGAVGELAGLWADEADRDAYLQTQSGFIEEALDCLRSLGKTDEAEPLITIIADPASRSRRLENDAKYRRWGHRLMLANVACAAGSIWLAQLVNRISSWPLVLLAVVLILSLAFGFLYLLFDLAIARVAPTQRRSGGAMILFLASSPWIAAIFLLVVFLLDPDRST